MKNVYETMKELNITLPKAPERGGLYTPAKRFGKNLVYISGCGPVIDEPVCGILGREFTKDQGVEFSRNSSMASQNRAPCFFSTSIFMCVTSDILKWSCRYT